MIIERFKQLLDDMITTQIPDIHFTAGSTPHVRKHSGDIEVLTSFGTTEKEDILAIITEMIGPERTEKLMVDHEGDFSYAHGIHKFRVNVFENAKGFGIAIRYIPTNIPSCKDLTIPEEVMKLLHRDKGLIIVTGPTGSGKSTTLASMIEYINTTMKKHIITIEDPIEFNFQGKDCLIHQREVGTHTNSFARAIKSALREDPDIIMVGEMRDPETIQAALTLAETGHLVLSTLHTNDTVQSIDRIIDSFPPAGQSQIRVQLAMSLAAVVSQTLLPKKNSGGRIVAREILMNNDAIRSIIIQGLTHQIYSMIELGGNEGMILMDKYLEMLYNKNLITKDTFASRVRDKDLVAKF
ncbi:MAG: PilT/PilU family type 4a pilus ATPase [Candidatus Gracilibacteria bacterium]|nr:PilT/PilU family type 4a pilus ATPase [Candidatus Gracilibacteria bacterium]